MHERRKARLPSLGEQLVREPPEVLTQGGIERMRGILGLNQHFALRLAAPGASGHLSEQCIKALGRAKVRVVERAVGIEHAERQVRKVMSFARICVPTRTSTSRARIRLRIASQAFLRRVLSRSIRSTRA